MSFSCERALLWLHKGGCNEECVASVCEAHFEVNLFMPHLMYNRLFWKGSLCDWSCLIFLSLLCLPWFPLLIAPSPHLLLVSLSLFFLIHLQRQDGEDLVVKGVEKEVTAEAFTSLLGPAASSAAEPSSVRKQIPKQSNGKAEVEVVFRGYKTDRLRQTDNLKVPCRRNPPLHPRTR